jgi:hypothetical protein
VKFERADFNEPAGRLYRFPRCYTLTDHSAVFPAHVHCKCKCAMEEYKDLVRRIKWPLSRFFMRVVQDSDG